MLAAYFALGRNRPVRFAFFLNSTSAAGKRQGKRGGEVSLAFPSGTPYNKENSEKEEKEYGDCDGGFFLN